MKSGFAEITCHKDEDELELEQLGNSTLWDEIVIAIYDSRYIAPIIALIAMYLSYHMTIAPHRGVIDRYEIPNINLAEVRPILDDKLQSVLQTRLMFAETHMTIPTDEEIHFKFQQHTNVPGNARLPSFFYSGVTFGLTWQNPHDLYFTSKNKLGSKDLKHDLAHFHPRPTHLMKRYSTYENATEISEDGFGIFFSYEDLEKQGKLSSDKLQPWKRILEDILVVARKYRQVYVILWYPYRFGKDLDTNQDGDRYRHYSIIQQIVPTRTGLNGIKSTSAVWLSSVNVTEPVVRIQR